MSITSLAPKFSYGISSKLRQNVLFYDENTILYPAGGNIILYNNELKTQKFLPISEHGQGISAMSLSSNKRFLAISEMGKTVSISIYDLHSMRRKKSLFSTDSAASEISLVAFSADCKYIAAISKDVNPKIFLWLWEKSKLLCSQSIGINQGAEITDLKFHPTEHGEVSMVGDGVFKTWRYHDGAFKATSAHRQETKSFSSHIWLTQKHILLSTFDGKYYIADDVELHQDLVHVSENDILYPIKCLIHYGTGFISGNGNGAVQIYEKTDDKEGYKRTKEILTNDQEIGIHSIALSPSEEFFVVTLENNQIFAYSLAAAEILKEHTSALFSFSYHHGAILGLDTCIRKPILATCSSDRSVRIWNYLENTCNFVRYFNEELFSVSLHPAGYMVLIGFTDRLRLMNLLIDDIKVIKEFPVRSCRESKFSNGGQYFAAVNGNTIHVYSTWTYELVSILKGHIGKVRSIWWSNDDFTLVTAGMDGAVYEWSIRDGRRQMENVLKSCSYYSAIGDAAFNQVYAVGNDSTLKVIHDGQIVKEYPTNGMMTQLCLTQSTFIAGSSNGTIRVLRYPLDEKKLDFQEHPLHSSLISKIRVSFDNRYMFSASEDGCLYVCSLSEREEKLQRTEEYTYSNEIMVTKSDLDEKTLAINELKSRVEELKMENEYQLRLKELSYKERLQEITEKLQAEVDTLKVHAASLKTEKEQTDLHHAEEIGEINEKCQLQIRDMETLNSEKLLAEYQKYSQLQEKLAKVQLHWEKLLREQSAKSEKTMTEMQEAYEKRLSRKEDEIAELREEMRKQIRDFDATIKDTEEDADTEIMQLQVNFEHKIKEEQESNSRVKAENSILKKKFASLQKEIGDYRTELQKVYDNEKKLYSVIKNLEKDIVNLKKEVQERDETIVDKEKRIYDLKKKNQELEKFKFVLDHKITEMKHQIEPRETSIKTMTSQIKEMDKEIQIYYSELARKDRAASEMKNKLVVLEKEIEKERVKVYESKIRAERIRDSIYSAVQNSGADAIALQSRIIEIYQKYCLDTDNDSTTPEAASQVTSSEKKSPTEENKNISQEFERQRAFMEKTITGLKKKVEKEVESSKAAQIRLMSENSNLLKELNVVRKSLLSMKKEKLKGKPSMKEANKMENSMFPAINF